MSDLRAHIIDDDEAARRMSAEARRAPARGGLARIFHQRTRAVAERGELVAERGPSRC